MVFDKILSITKGLSDELQSQNVNLACAATLVTACEGSLEAFRSDHMWEKLFKSISDICEQHEIEITDSWMILLCMSCLVLEVYQIAVVNLKLSFFPCC